MYSDDLVPILAADPGPGLRFRQGVVASWNAATGANTIDVGGATLIDVPILNTGEAIALKAGHVVALLQAGSSWFILGRVTTPGSADFASASVAFDRNANTALGFAINSTFSDKVTASLPVPAWADEAAVLVVATATVHNTSATTENVALRATIAGTVGAQSKARFVTGTIPVFVAASTSRVVTNPGATITVTGQMASDSTSTTSASNLLNVDVLGIFRSVT